jgi:glycosyltransferase involved in cell wall biosynthesis
MLRIAVVTQYFPSSAEPWQGRSAYQTLRLVARETELQVFYPNAAYPSVLKPRSRIYEKLDRSFSPPDVKTSYFDYPALPLVSRPFNGWLSARTLLPAVRRFAPDLIFSIYLYPAGYAALAIGKAISVPVVSMSIGSDINNIGDGITARYTRTVLRESDFLVTVSDDLRQKAIAMGTPFEKARTIVNGCDLSVFHVRDREAARRKLGIDPGVRAVVYIGRIDVKKGLRELVDAAASLHANHPALHVYMVGEGPDRPILEAAIQACNGDAFIHLMGACAFDDVAVWMAASDLVTLPSYMEGCPNVVLEALACGRPVVATRVGGIPEIMNNDCGRLIEPRDSSDLAQALASVLKARWDANAISAHWSRSWSTVARELLQVFETVAPGKGAASTARNAP